MREMERETERGLSVQVHLPNSWARPNLAGRSQEPGASFECPMWVHGLKHLGHPLRFLQAYCQGAGSESGRRKLNRHSYEMLMLQMVAQHAIP